MLRAMFLPGQGSLPEQQSVLRGFVPEGDAKRPNTRTTWKSRALKPIFLTGKDMLKFLEEDDALNHVADDRGGVCGEIDDAVMPPRKRGIQYSGPFAIQLAIRNTGIIPRFADDGGYFLTLLGLNNRPNPDQQRCPCSESEN